MSYTYPATLPLPVSLEFTPADRLRRSAIEGYSQAVRIERDFRGTESVGIVFTEDEAGQFDDWHRVALRDGGMLWRAAWPVPPGWDVSCVRKFAGALKWTPTQLGIWSLSANTEVYGAYASELIGAFDVENKFDGTWTLSGARYLYKFVRPA